MQPPLVARDQEQLGYVLKVADWEPDTDKRMVGSTGVRSPPSTKVPRSSPLYYCIISIYDFVISNLKPER